MRSLRRMPAAVAISARARSPAFEAASSAARAASIASPAPAELDEQAAARHEQREPRFLRDGERETALDQRERRGVAELLGEGEARVEVGGGGARIVGAVEVLGGEHAVAAREPFGGAGMQGAPPLVEERCVGAVADQRMAEHELAAVGADQEVLDQQARQS